MTNVQSVSDSFCCPLLTFAAPILHSENTVLLCALDFNKCSAENETHIPAALALAGNGFLCVALVFGFFLCCFMAHDFIAVGQEDACVKADGDTATKTAKVD